MLFTQHVFQHVQEATGGGASLGNPAKFKNWRKHSASVRDRLGMSSRSKPWTGSVTVPRCFQDARSSDILNVAWRKRRNTLGQQATFEEVSQGLWADPTQAVQRSPWGDTPPCLCQGTKPYSFEKNTALSGMDAMRLQGFPEQLPPEHVVTDKNLRSLAGEAFSLPMMAGVFYAYWLNPRAPWWA